MPSPLHISTTQQEVKKKDLKLPSIGVERVKKKDRENITTTAGIHSSTFAKSCLSAFIDHNDPERLGTPFCKSHKTARQLYSGCDDCCICGCLQNSIMVAKQMKLHCCVSSRAMTFKVAC